VKASSELSRLSELALRQRRLGLAKLPPVIEILRGFADGALCDPRESILQVCRRKTLARLVFICHVRSGRNYRQPHAGGEGR